MKRASGQSRNREHWNKLYKIEKGEGTKLESSLGTETMGTRSKQGIQKQSLRED